MAPGSLNMPVLPNGGDGILEPIFRALSADAGKENLYLYQNSRKCQRRGETADTAIRRTRSGLNAKLHAIVDGLGNPVEFILSAGNDHNSVYIVELLGKGRHQRQRCTGKSCL